MESAMEIRGKGASLAAALSILFSLACGCAPAKETVRGEGPEVAVRIPPGREPIDVRLLSARPQKRPEPPYSVADESRGRWLTLFEVTFSPVVPESLPETEADEN
jgi:hypothetical protein